VRALSIIAVVAGCGRAPVQIVPGERIDDVELGMTWREVRDMLGDPPTQPTMLVRLGHVRWPARELEVLLTSPDESMPTDDAIVIGVASTAVTSRQDLAVRFGAANETYGGRDFYASGLAVERGDGDAVNRVAVFAADGAPRAGIAAPEAVSGVEIDGRSVDIVDMHLHPGDYATMAATGKEFVAASLPPFLQLYAPELLDRLSDPWAPHVGIAEQTALAAIGHAVLFAVYAPRSTGTFSNEALLDLLTDPRNVAADGRPWAWGMASIDLEDWSEETAAIRFAALRDALAERPEHLIGIKLAFAHQGVALDDAATRGIYAIADEAGVPVLHHTGFSPFPGTESDPRYYDPSYLAAMLDAYPNVHVVLSHVGQGDARAVDHALDLAVAHDRVWLELSALGRPLLVAEDGAPVHTTEPQYPAVLAAIRKRGVIDRTLFASDGPQYPGAVRAYLGKLVDGMRTAGYTADEIEAVLSRNFERLFTRVRR
jgi:predicted TIM-barrel fold metal-dependent hydrolase